MDYFIHNVCQNNCFFYGAYRKMERNTALFCHNKVKGSICHYIVKQRQQAIAYLL
jgi:hypothetical protein